MNASKLLDAPARLMAVALPMNGLHTWRVYLGLPMFGSRAPEGGPEKSYRLARENYVLDVERPQWTVDREVPSHVRKFCRRPAR